MDIKTTLCSQLHAPFLIDNAVEMKLDNFNYTETNIVKNLNDFSLTTDRLFQFFFIFA